MGLSTTGVLSFFGHVYLDWGSACMMKVLGSSSTTTLAFGKTRRSYPSRECLGNILSPCGPVHLHPRTRAELSPPLPSSLGFDDAPWNEPLAHDLYVLFLIAKRIWMVDGPFPQSDWMPSTATGLKAPKSKIGGPLSPLLASEAPEPELLPPILGAPRQGNSGRLEGLASCTNVATTE